MTTPSSLCLIFSQKIKVIYDYSIKDGKCDQHTDQSTENPKTTYNERQKWDTIVSDVVNRCRLTVF